MADYGLKIAQPGYDVATATNGQLVLSSGFNTLKNYLTGVVSVTVPGSTIVGAIIGGTVTHNLGFVPAVFVYPNDGTISTTITDNNPNFNSTKPNSTNLIDNFKFDYYLGTGNLKIYLQTIDQGGTPKTWGTANNPQYTINYKYYIYTQKIG